MKAAWWTTVVCEATQTCGTTLSVWETLEMDSNHSSGRQLNICSQLHICSQPNICAEFNFKFFLAAHFQPLGLTDSFMIYILQQF